MLESAKLTVKADHPKFTVGKTLYGVIVDWSDAQIRGLKEAVGSELAMGIIKGCQVCSVHSLHV